MTLEQAIEAWNSLPTLYELGQKVAKEWWQDGSLPKMRKYTHFEEVLGEEWSRGFWDMVRAIDMIEGKKVSLS